MLTDSKVARASIKMTGIEEVKVPTTGIEEYKTPTTGILEVPTPTTGIEDVELEHVSSLENSTIAITETESSDPVKAPAGTVTYSIEKEFRTGQRLWHPIFQEAGNIIAEENFRGVLILAEKGKSSEEYSTAHHTKTPSFLTVVFDKAGKRRIVCNLELSR